MTVEIIDEVNLKQDLFGLVVALVEIIRDALQRQTLRQMEGGRLVESEIERLGDALVELDDAIEQIKEEMGIADTIKSIREGLDEAVGNLIDDFVNPDKWLSMTDRGIL